MFLVGMSSEICNLFSYWNSSHHSVVVSGELMTKNCLSCFDNPSMVSVVSEYNMRLLLIQLRYLFNKGKAVVLCPFDLRLSLILPNHYHPTMVTRTDKHNHLASIPIDDSIILLIESKVCVTLTAAKPMTSYSSNVLCSTYLTVMYLCINMIASVQDCTILLEQPKFLLGA